MIQLEILREWAALLQADSELSRLTGGRITAGLFRPDDAIDLPAIVIEHDSDERLPSGTNVAVDHVLRGTAVIAAEGSPFAAGLAEIGRAIHRITSQIEDFSATNGQLIQIEGPFSQSARDELEPNIVRLEMSYLFSYQVPIGKI